MSNLIKAYSIKYNEDNKKVIDKNLASEEIVKRYVELLQAKDESIKTQESNEPEFIQGLVAATVEELSGEEIEEQEQLQQQKLQEETLEQRKKESAEKLQQEAEQIINDAKEEVKKLLANATADAENKKNEIFERAKQEGYLQGKKLADTELLQEQEKLNQRIEELEYEYEQKVKDFEPKFVELLISFIRRFTGVILDDKKDIILYLLEQELLNIESSNVYLIRVSKEDFDMVNSKKNEIKWKLKENAELEILEDRMLGRAQCMIETDSRIIDCSLDVQLKNLVGNLKLLAGSRSERQEQTT